LPVRRAPLAAAVLCAGVAHASPLLAPAPGGPVFVGPTSAHVTSILYNPAAAGLMQGHHLLVSGTGRLERDSIERSTISSADGEPAAGGDRAFPATVATGFTPAGFVGFTSDLSSENVTFGLAISTPFAQRLPSYDESLGYHALSGSLYAPAFSGAMSYRVSRTLYVGAGFTILFPKLDVAFFRDGNLDGCAAPPCNIEDPAARQRWNVQSSFAVVPAIGGINFGGLYRIGDWWLGAGVDFLFLGHERKVAEVTIEDPGGTIRARGRVSYALPQLLHLGVRRPAFGGFELLVNATYARTSSHETVDLRLVDAPDGIPGWVVRHRGFDDTLAVEVGLEQPPASQLRVGIRLRAETSAVAANEVSVAQIDAPEAGVAAGAEVRLSSSMALVAAASVSLMLPVDADPSRFSPRAAIDCAAADFDLAAPACETARRGLATPTAAGSYGRVSGQLSLGFTYDWW
jgi:long-subunit fatty acid transport protein